MVFENRGYISRKWWGSKLEVKPKISRRDAEKFRRKISFWERMRIKSSNLVWPANYVGRDKWSRYLALFSLSIFSFGLCEFWSLWLATNRNQENFAWRTLQSAAFERVFLVICAASLLASITALGAVFLRRNGLALVVLAANFIFSLFALLPIIALAWNAVGV